MTASKRANLKRTETKEMMDAERKWHTAFTWFPVLSEDGYWVWLDTVYRCRAHRFEPWRYLADVHNVMAIADES